MRITRRKDILTSQEKSIIIKDDTIFWFKSLINHENERIELHDYDRIITKERVINIYVQKNDCNEIKL